MSRRPPTWSVLGTLVAAPLFMGSVILYVPYTLTGWRVGPPLLGWPLLRWLGVGLIVLSVPLLLDFCVRFVVEGHGTPVPMAPPQQLVVRGPYRYVRNPAYLGAVALVAGQALWLGSVSCLLYALALAILFHLFVIAYEEPTLRGKFGEAYESYRNAVPRWIPRRISRR